MKITMLIYIVIIITCVIWVASGGSVILPILALFLIATDIEFRLKKDIDEDEASQEENLALQKNVMARTRKELRKAKISA